MQMKRPASQVDEEASVKLQHIERPDADTALETASGVADPDGPATVEKLLTESEARARVRANPSDTAAASALIQLNLVLEGVYGEQSIKSQRGNLLSQEGSSSAATAVSASACMSNA